MLHIGKDIHSLTDFKRRTSQLVEQLHESGRPIVLTVNGRAEIVVQDAGAYQELVEAAEQWRAQQRVTSSITKETTRGTHAAK